MSKRRAYLIAGIISILLLLLIVIQYFWLMKTSAAQVREMNLQVSKALERVEKEILSTANCVELFTRYPLMPGNGFYIVQQRHENDIFTGQPDTISMYYDYNEYRSDTGEMEIPYRFSSIKSTYPVTVEMLIKLNYDNVVTPGFIKDTINRTNFRDKMASDIIIDSVFNMEMLDSLIGSGLMNAGVSRQYGFGLVDNAGNITYSKRINDTSVLISSPHKVQLFSGNRFIRPVTLSLVFPMPFGIHAPGALMILSIAVLVLLLLSFYTFIRLYVRQIRLSEMRSDFINNLTHEFNTPMANIALAVETIEDSGLSGAKIDKSLNIIAAESRRLKSNIEMALQVARMEKNKLHLRKEKVDLIALFNTIQTSFQVLAEKYGGGISFEYAGPVFVDADETHLLNSICNILDNAIKYRNGVPYIHVRVFAKDNYGVMEISDNGIGMNNKVLKHVFDKFYRAHEGNVHNTKGFGLGLNYVKGVIDAHNGKIIISSKPGRGTKVTISLPKNKS